MRGLAILVGIFHVGFWNYGPVSLLHPVILLLYLTYTLGEQDQYVIHSFVDRSVNLAGLPPFSRREPLLHGHQISLSSHDPSLALPPVGVFNWHYVQCVLKKFATPEYQEINNVSHFVFPFCTKDGDEDESDVNFDDPENIK